MTKQEYFNKKYMEVLLGKYNDLLAALLVYPLEAQLNNSIEHVQYDDELEHDIQIADIVCKHNGTILRDVKEYIKTKI
jgi:hypothetical protein